MGSACIKSRRRKGKRKRKRKRMIRKPRKEEREEMISSNSRRNARKGKRRSKNGRPRSSTRYGKDREKEDRQAKGQRIRDGQNYRQRNFRSGTGISGETGQKGTTAEKAREGGNNLSSRPEQVRSHGRGSTVEQRARRRLAIVGPRGKSFGRSLRQLETAEYGCSRRQTKEGTAEVQAEETGEEGMAQRRPRRCRRTGRFCV